MAADRTYQDFYPTYQWVSQPGLEVLVFDLPGFKKEQLRVQITATGKIRLTGERPTEGNKWIRFRQEVPLPRYFDADLISARFVNDKLYIEHPKVEQTKSPTQPEKLVASAGDQPEKPPTQPEKPVASAGDQPETRRDGSEPSRVEEEKKPRTKQPVDGTTTQPRTVPEKPEEEKPGFGGTDQQRHDAEKEKESRKGKEKMSDETNDQHEAKRPLISKEEEKEKGWMERDAKIKKLMVCNFAAVVLIVMLILLYARNAVRCYGGI